MVPTGAWALAALARCGGAPRVCLPASAAALRLLKCAHRGSLRGPLGAAPTPSQPPAARLLHTSTHTHRCTRRCATACSRWRSKCCPPEETCARWACRLSNTLCVCVCWWACWCGEACLGRAAALRPRQRCGGRSQLLPGRPATEPCVPASPCLRSHASSWCWLISGGRLPSSSHAETSTLFSLWWVRARARAQQGGRLIGGVSGGIAARRMPHSGDTASLMCAPARMLPPPLSGREPGPGPDDAGDGTDGGRQPDEQHRGGARVVAPPRPQGARGRWQAAGAGWVCRTAKMRRQVEAAPAVQARTAGAAALSSTAQPRCDCCACCADR